MLAIGIDLVEVRRIESAVERWGQRFLCRVYTTAEMDYCGRRSQSLAARWAAKEAVSKALGAGWAPQAEHEAGWVDWTEIEIVRESSGQPAIRLSGKALARAEALGLRTWRVSMSHTADHAVAMVLGWPGSQEPGTGGR